MYAKIKQGNLPELYKKSNLKDYLVNMDLKQKKNAIKHATADTLKQAEDIDYLNLDRNTTN